MDNPNRHLDLLQIFSIAVKVLLDKKACYNPVATEVPLRVHR